MAATKALQLAQMYVDAGRWNDALRELGAALSAEPDNAPALVLTAYCHLQTNQPELALRAADAAGRASPDWEQPAIVRSAALLGLGRRKEAEEAAAAAVRLAPDSVDAHVQQINVQASRRFPRKAGRESARAALRLAPQSARVHVAVGNLQTRSRPKKARASYQEALRLDPHNRTAQYNLAQLGQHYGNWPQSVQHLLGLLRVAPDDPRYEKRLRSTLAGVLILAGMAALVAVLLVAPGEGRPDLTPGRSVAALFIAVVAQLLAAVWLRVAAGRQALRFLLGIGWRRKVMIGSLIGLAVVDLSLLLLIFIPDAVVPLTALAMAGTFGALFGIVATVAQRDRI